MSLNSDIKVLHRIAEQRDYTFGSAVIDATGVGAIYSAGADMANIARLQKMLSKNPAFKGLVEEYLTSSKRSLAGRAVYLGSIIAGAAGTVSGITPLSHLGLAGMAGMLTLFMMRAGYNATDRGAFEAIQKYMTSTPLKEKTV